ncbi:MAG TPA: sugar phosphate nucleotidyltransferase, partial [Candidatus Limnocylindria bacterium]|nr:sugar phosphate nucleotidyltransferase [Candidatus Limnocylindria bacterium]
MKQDIAGLIYTGERVDDLQELTRYRAAAALPMVSRYRLIDFILSSMIHSGIRNIGIIMQKNYHSLMDHLGSGREWNLHGKRSGMTILPPLMSQDNVGTYRGFLDALHSNTGFMRGTDERFLAVSDSHVLYQADFRDVVNRHVSSKADITLLYTRDGNVRRNGRGRYLRMEDGLATRLEIDPMIPRFENTYIGAFVARRELLIDLVDRAASSGQHHFSRDLLAQMISERIYRVGGYEVEGRVWMVDSVQAYFRANMDFLNESHRSQAFRDDRPVWTKLRDEMPARYASGAKVTNA